MGTLRGDVSRINERNAALPVPCAGRGRRVPFFHFTYHFVAEAICGAQSLWNGQRFRPRSGQGALHRGNWEESSAAVRGPNLESAMLSVNTLCFLSASLLPGIDAPASKAPNEPAAATVRKA